MPARAVEVTANFTDAPDPVDPDPVDPNPGQSEETTTAGATKIYPAKTGDNSKAVLWISIMLASGVALVTLANRSKEELA